MSIKRELKEFAEEVEHLGIEMITTYTKYHENNYIISFNGRVLVETLSEYTAINYLKGFSSGVCVGEHRERGEL